MIKPCPFCGSQPKYTEHITFMYTHGCIALAYIECRKCLNGRGRSEVRRTIDWRNQDIVDQILTVWPGIKLKWLTIDGRIDPVVKRTIAPILRAAIIALWNNRPNEPRYYRYNWTADRAYQRMDPREEGQLDGHNI